MHVCMCVVFVYLIARFPINIYSNALKGVRGGGRGEGESNSRLRQVYVTFFAVMCSYAPRTHTHAPSSSLLLLPPFRFPIHAGASSVLSFLAIFPLVAAKKKAALARTADKRVKSP